MPLYTGIRSNTSSRSPSSDQHTCGLLRIDLQLRGIVPLHSPTSLPCSVAVTRLLWVIDPVLHMAAVIFCVSSGCWALSPGMCAMLSPAFAQMTAGVNQSGCKGVVCSMGQRIDSLRGSCCPVLGANPALLLTLVLVDKDKRDHPARCL